MKLSTGTTRKIGIIFKNSKKVSELLKYQLHNFTWSDTLFDFSATTCVRLEAYLDAGCTNPRSILPFRTLYIGACMCLSNFGSLFIGSEDFWNGAS